MNDKITVRHLERAAYVYIRQSTLQQVRNNLESNRRQYELQARAREFGFAQVIVIDEDLGVSGTGSKERPGFGRLLAAVCDGESEPSLLSRRLVWRATTAIGITLLTCACSPTPSSSTQRESTTRGD